MDKTERLRELVVAIDSEMSGVSTTTRAQWTELVMLLALGPSPLRRKCPSCAQMVMEAATRCGYCWKPLPLAEPPAS
jgi:hypothetical protein